MLRLFPKPGQGSAHLSEHRLVRQEKEVKRIAVWTSGRDAPGMNAAIRAVVRTGIDRGWCEQEASPPGDGGAHLGPG